MLNKAARVVVRGANGTYLRMDLGGRVCHPDDGLLHTPGKYGNLPAGEAFLAPLEGTTQGVLIAEWSQTDKLKRPLALWVRDGLLHEVEGEGPAADLLRKKMRESPLNANVAELGVGTNPGRSGRTTSWSPRRSSARSTWRSATTTASAGRSRRRSTRTTWSSRPR